MGFSADSIGRAGRDRKLAKEIIVEILRQSGSRFEGTGRLYKAFYFAHLYYFENNDGFMSDWPVVRMPNGPGIDNAKELLAELAHEGRLNIKFSTNGPYRERWFELTADDVETTLAPEAKRAIAQAVAFVADKTATELSALTHEHSVSWQKSSDGDELNIYADVLDAVEEASQKSLMELEREALLQVFKK